MEKAEERIVNELYRDFARNFPKKCGACDRVFESEIDYLTRTKRCGNAANYEEIDILQFSRNCGCGSTLALNLEPQTFGLSKRLAFDAYIHARSLKEKEGFETLLAEANAGGVSAVELLKSERAKNLWSYLTGHISSARITDFEKSPSLDSLNEDIWVQIALDRFRDDYNEWVRENEEAPEKRILVLDDEKRSSLSLQNLRIPHMKWIYTNSPSQAANSFKANPEMTSLVFIDVSPTCQRESELVELIKEYSHGKPTPIPVIGINGKTCPPYAKKVIQKSDYSVMDIREAISGYARQAEN